MKTAKKLLTWTLALTCVSAMAVDRPPDAAHAIPTPHGQTSPDVDNTDINKRDKGEATATPQDQSNRAQDRELLASVRRAIVAEKSFSTLAHNAKILVAAGAVTLRGPVESDKEKALVESLVKNVGGVTTVDNQLDVQTSP